MYDDQLILDGIRARVGTLEKELTILEDAYRRVADRINPPAPAAAPAAPKRKRVRRTKAQLAAAKVTAAPVAPESEPAPIS